MPRPERGASPSGFRSQLLARFRNEAQARHISAQRLQQRVAFERFLARLGSSGDWVLKGGLALELRYGWENRPTKDIDLRIAVTTQEAVAQLRVVLAESHIHDNFSFELGAAAQEIQGAPGGTLRVPVVARLAGQTFSAFHIDLSSGDPMTSLPDALQGSDLLNFAGIAPIHFPAYPVEQHLAEKVHAYSLPRTTMNTRVKDLVDLVTFAVLETVDGDLLTASVRATFAARNTHPLLSKLPEPPAEWAASFERLTKESLLTSNVDLLEGFKLVVSFWNPVLDGAVSGQCWFPTERHWLHRVEGHSSVGEPES